MVGADFITGKAVSYKTPSILQHQGFLGAQTTQVDVCSAVTDGGHIFVDRHSCSYGQLLNEVSGTAHAEPFNIDPAVNIDRLRANFFRGRNVGARYNNLLNCCSRLACWRCEYRLLRLRLNSERKSYSGYCEITDSVAASLGRGALAV